MSHPHTAATGAPVKLLEALGYRRSSKAQAGPFSAVQSSGTTQVTSNSASSSALWLIGRSQGQVTSTSASSSDLWLVGRSVEKRSTSTPSRFSAAYERPSFMAILHGRVCHKMSPSAHPVMMVAS